MMDRVRRLRAICFRTTYPVRRPLSVAVKLGIAGLLPDAISLSTYRRCSFLKSAIF